jgi:hypothetical protein
MGSAPRLYNEDLMQLEVEQMLAALDKANPDTENIRSLKLAAVKHTTVQVTRLLL